MCVCVRVYELYFFCQDFLLRLFSNIIYYFYICFGLNY